MSTKVTIEYDYSEDSRSAEKHALRCLKSEDMALVLWEITHNLKKKAEWAEQEDKDVILFIFDSIREMLDEHGIVIDDLTE